MDKCKHKWVNYQPFQGEEYVCCANAGCGVKFMDWLNEELKTTHPVKPDASAGWLALFEEQSLPAGISEKKVDVPLKLPPKKGWAPVDYGYYLNGIDIMIPDTEEDISWIVKEYDCTGKLPEDKL